MSLSGFDFGQRKDANEYGLLHIHIPYDTSIFETQESYDDFVKSYEQHVLQHNQKIFDSVYKDAGFDLLLPSDLTIKNPLGNTTVPNSPSVIDLGVQCSMYKLLGFIPCKMTEEKHMYKEYLKPLSYFLLPRSSTGLKTPLRLANSTGVIDSGYRGNIKACVDYVSSSSSVCKLDKGQRIFQFCNGELMPILAKIVTDPTHLDLEDLDAERGAGGFGSTGSGVQTVGNVGDASGHLRQRHLNGNGVLID